MVRDDPIGDPATADDADASESNVSSKSNVSSESNVPSKSNVIAFPEQRGPQPAPERRTVRHAIGDVLRQERQDQQRTIADVAEHASVSLPYLSEIERGRKEVSSDLLESVCDALEVTTADVLERAARRLRVHGSLRSGQRFDATLLAA